jgi:hypothetical protein
VAAVVCIGGMLIVLVRLFARRGTDSAVARAGEPVESSLYGASAPDGTEVFDGFSYRVSARFAGRSRVIVDGDRVTFTGPRGPHALYVLWIALQGVLMAAVPVAVVWAAVTLEWRGLVWAVALLVASTVVMAVGAGVWPGLGEVPGLTDGLMPTLEFERRQVRDVTIGSGWANGGLAIILFPYMRGIDALAEEHAVSWWGPDERGREVRYALHCYDTERAVLLYRLLSYSGSDIAAGSR